MLGPGLRVWAMVGVGCAWKQWMSGVRTWCGARV